MGELIFVEGVPGTGKSTTAQFLARQLTHHGQPARWIYEEEVPNPFVPDMPAAGFETWEDFAEAHVARWHAFAKSAELLREILIVESFLLQRPVFTMLRRDAAPATIDALVNRFADAVAPLRPTLIYLAHPDPAHAWRAVMAKRGATVIAQSIARSADWPFVRSRGLTGLDGVLAYWQAHAALCNGIVSRLPMTTHVIDAASGPWTERRRTICATLGVATTEPPTPDPRALAPRAGRYRDGEKEISVTLEADGLVLRGALWDANRLLPVATCVFDVEAWPLRVHFEPSGHGAPLALRWDGSRLWWGGPQGVYARVAHEEDG